MGTDLTWMVGPRMMSYNVNARVGSIRANAEETAILLRVDSAGENGIARRISVLTIDARPLAADPVSVRCHNGSAEFAQEIHFWPKTAGISESMYNYIMHSPLVHFRSPKQTTDCFQLHRGR